MKVSYYHDPFTRCSDNLMIDHLYLLIGLEGGQKDASSVRANSPILRKGGVYYYEVTIVSSGQKK